MPSEYFLERQRRAAESVTAAMAVEASVCHDISRVLDHVEHIATTVRHYSAYWMRRTIAADTEAADHYARTRSSMLLVELARLYEGLDVPAMLRELAMQPTPFSGVDVVTGEMVILLANGYELRSGWIDKDDPDRLPGGDYISVLNLRGEQVFYGDAADLFVDPLKSRQSMFEILQACCGARVTSTPAAPHQNGLTPPL